MVGFWVFREKNGGIGEKNAPCISELTNLTLLKNQSFIRK